MDDSFVTVDRAAIALGVSQSTVLRRCRSGDLSAVYERGKWWVPRARLPGTVSRHQDDDDDPVANLRRRLAAMPGLLTAEQVADVTGMSIWSVRAAMRSGDIPSVRVGSRRLSPKAALVSWLGLAS